MNDKTSTYFEIADLYRAYKKAKADAFYDGVHGDPLIYERFERSLEKNLNSLLVRLRLSDWMDDLSFIGGYAYLPKSVDEPAAWRPSAMHFSTSAMGEDWDRRFARSRSRAEVSFRLIIRASVEYQILSALWIIKVGEKFDARLNDACAYGNRLRRHDAGKNGLRGLNENCAGLFYPYFGAYRAWRSNGLRTIRSELDSGRSVIAVTMDVKRFYHNVSPRFLLEKSFLREIGLTLSSSEMAFCQNFIASMEAWYRATPDHADRPEGGLPVGLSASKVISNVLLIEFDRVIKSSAKPVYYGRYVDDIFMVVEPETNIDSGEQFISWLAKRYPSRLKVRRNDGALPTLEFVSPYTHASLIEFSGEKQKIFSLSGRFGLDLVDQIEEQVKLHSSEYRMLPTLPETDGEMLSSAFLATPDATLEADALRKADVISVRRLGFALLLGDMEAHARDLRPATWVKQRQTFYGLVLRHVLTPKGYFNFHAYLCRIFGLMVACNDIDDAKQFVSAMLEVADRLRRTSTAGTSGKKRFDSCLSFYGELFYRAAIQSSTVHNFPFSTEFFALLSWIKKCFVLPRLPQLRKNVQALSIGVLRSDFGRRAYKDYWFDVNPKHKAQPSFPADLSVRRVLRLRGVRRFRKEVSSGLRQPYWPAIMFPTRPLTAAEVLFVAPSLLRDPIGLREAVFALRGAKIRVENAPRLFGDVEHPHLLNLYVPFEKRSTYKVALSSFLTPDEQWEAALVGRPLLTFERYRRINGIVNDILKCAERPDYVVFPEASIPRKWAISISTKLARTGISFMAGLESWSRRKDPFRNEALVSLASRWPGYRSHLLYSQPKMLPAHHEARSIEMAQRTFKVQRDIEICRPIYLHGGHFFSVLLCSDLTNIDNRRHVQGHVDSLFALEWNQDTTSFSALVESAALDVHAFVVQVNNRRYGDSRVRSPRSQVFERDLVRVKGGDADYFVVATLSISELREFQRNGGSSKGLGFKPVPIGYRMSNARR
jgi:hypothetical protein